MVILPTHTCFDDALEFIEAHVRRQPELVFQDTMVLVHGICSLEGGHKYSHAWVENGDMVWDCGIANGEKVYFTMKYEDFAKSRRVEKATRYTIREVHELNSASGHYGPWCEEYMQLCRNGGKRT